jgi:hypothetical protein
MWNLAIFLGCLRTFISNLLMINEEEGVARRIRVPSSARKQPVGFLFRMLKSMRFARIRYARQSKKNDRRSGKGIQAAWLTVRTLVVS